MDKSARTEALTALAQIAGKTFDTDLIAREGSRIVIPENMSPVAAHKQLGAYIEEQEAEKVFAHKTKYRYLDGLVATKNVLKKITGMTRTSITYRSLFGSFTPPALNVQIAYDQWEEAPTGTFPVELWEGAVEVSAYRDPEAGILFSVSVTAPVKYSNAIKGFFKLIDAQLEENSIYRGKAITAQETPEFLDLRAVNPEKVVYSDDVMTQLNANVWSLLEHTQAMRDNGLPLKRAALLEGPYGTGKTLAAFLTAQKAVENGWTFIFVRPGKDDLRQALATAQLYQPSVVFFEDIDSLADSDLDVSSLLDMFDGIQAKGTEIIAVLTTNHADRIHKGLVRPGRLDAVIHIGELDNPGIERLIRATVDARWLPDNLDVEMIGEAMQGFMPAFVKEAVDRAIRYSIARHGEPTEMTSEDFRDAALGLRPQLDLMNAAGEGEGRPALDTVFTEMVDKQLTNRTVRYESAEGEIAFVLGDRREVSA